jgi:putative endonuclease
MVDFYYTYILKSEKDGKNYAGYTQDLNLRFEQHNKGQVESTKYRSNCVFEKLTQLRK